MNIVVVEGGPKQQKKYKQLMLRRIKWWVLEGLKSIYTVISKLIDEYSRNEDKYTDKDGSELENKAELVWEGQVRMQFDCHKSDLEIVTPAFK